MRKWSRVIPAILEKRDIWVAILVVSTIFAFLLNFYSLEKGVSIITPHLFYLPIVIAAYWFPRRGVILTVALAMGYLAMVYVLAYPDVDILTQATARFYVFVAIGVIVASLSNTLKEQEDRYHGIFDYSEAGVILVMNLRSGFIIEEVNQRGGDMLGYRTRDLAGTDFSSLFREEEEKSQILGKVSTGAAVTDFECRLRKKDGTDMRAFLSAGPLPGRRMVITLVDITGRKRAEEALRESKERYQRLFNNALVGLVQTRTGDGRVLEANLQMARMFGYDTVGEFVRKFSFPDHYVDQGTREQLIAALADDGSVANFEARFSRKDGSIMWTRFWARIYPEEGYFEQVFTDITEEKLSHRALNESEERYRKLVDNLPDYVVVYSSDRILYVNPAAAHAVGKIPEDLVNKPVFDFISPESWPEVSKFSRMRRSGNPVDPYEIEISVPDGVTRTVIVNGTPITYRNEPAILAVLTDITERKKAEEALTASKDQYMTTIDAMIDGLFLVDREMNLVLVNSTLRHWLERAGVSGEIRGRKVDAVIPWVTSKTSAELEMVFLTGESLVSIDEFAPKGRKYIFETRKIPVFEEGRVVRVVTIMRNITKARQIEEEKRMAYEQIEKNIEQFATLGDHLRNPMQVIVGLADLEGGSVADRINDQAREIDRTISQLDRGWIESEKIREFIRKYYGIGSK